MSSTMTVADEVTFEGWNIQVISNPLYSSTPLSILRLIGLYVPFAKYSVRI
jgi:hypothetical protein